MTKICSGNKSCVSVLLRSCVCVAPPAADLYWHHTAAGSALVYLPHFLKTANQKVSNGLPPVRRYACACVSVPLSVKQCVCVCV